MKPTIGFIGLGVMGSSIAGHLITAGHSLHVYNRTKEKALPLIAQGAHYLDTPKKIAQNCDIIFTMVGFPKDVESLYLSDDGLLSHASSGSLCIDMTTSSPLLAQKIAAAGSIKKINIIDAPVTGGDIGAQNGTLSIMVGGTDEGFQQSLPLLEIFGTKVLHMGAPGMGQHTKMSNQIAIASTMMGVCESLIYAESSGLNLKQVLEAIGAGAAGSSSLANLAPRILSEDYSPGFFTKHFIKDMTIALESAVEMSLNLPALKLSLSLYQELANAGFENDGTQALIRWYRNQKIN